MNFLNSKIALGTVQFGLNYGISNLNGITSIDEVEKILDVAKNYGIDLLDTASAYGDSEQTIGKVKSQEFRLISKFLGVTTESGLIAQFNNTLKNTNRDEIYGYLSHRPYEIIENPDLWNVLLFLQKKKKIRKIGFSFNSIEEYEAVRSLDIVPDIIQVPFNYFDRRFKKMSIELTRNYGTEVHVRSVFLQGLFFMNVNKLPPFFNPIKEILSEIQHSNLNLQLLHFVLNEDWVDKVVLGVNNHIQLEENINNTIYVDSLPELDSEVPENIISPSMWPK